MNASVTDWQSPRIAVAGGGQFAVRHIWCVGRNYAEHAREMGADPERETPVFFSKPATAAVNETVIACPERTGELHHEVELVAALGGGGRHLDRAGSRAAIFGCAVGVDLTRRDVQARAKRAGHPWEMSKGFDQSAPLGELVPVADWQPQGNCTIRLAVNGIERQRARLDAMIWPLAELVARLSREVTLYPGDLVFTGTPAGVDRLVADDRVRARIDGLPALEFTLATGRAG